MCHILFYVMMHNYTGPAAASFGDFHLAHNTVTTVAPIALAFRFSASSHCFSISAYLEFYICLSALGFLYQLHYFFTLPGLLAQ